MKELTTVALFGEIPYNYRKYSEEVKRMNDVTVFNNAEFGSVRTIEHENKVLFCGSDIAKALGYERPYDAINAHCRCTVKYRIPHPQSKDKTIEMTFISEGDVYRLIVSSKLPSSVKFETWVFDEVLPSIRKNGGYINNQESLTPEEIIAKALIVANNVIEQKNKQIEEMTPKAKFFDTVVASDGARSMMEVAKLVGIGRNKLFEILRNKNILNNRNIPYQSYMDRGYFKVVESAYTDGYGNVHTTITTLVYQKGIDFIVNNLLGCKAE